MVKIAFVGKKKAGKTFAAFYLQRHHNFTKMRMDDGVTKAMRFFYLYRKNERPSWARQLEFYDALYKVDPNVHIDYMLHRLSFTEKDVVIEDVRYLSELQRLKEVGFTIIRIAAPTTRRSIKGIKNAAAGTLLLQEHFNEDKTIGYRADYSIYNDTRDGTRKSLDVIVDKIRNDAV